MLSIQVFFVFSIAFAFLSFYTLRSLKSKYTQNSASKNTVFPLISAPR